MGRVLSAQKECDTYKECSPNSYTRFVVYTCGPCGCSSIYSIAFLSYIYIYIYIYIYMSCDWCTIKLYNTRQMG
jgi:hypothetical protein